MEKHIENRISMLDEIKPVNKKEWKKVARATAEIMATKTLDNLTPSHSVRDEVPHRAYTLAMGRKAHRHACLVAAQTVGEINWTMTKADWTVLKAADGGETLSVSVRMDIPKTEYERVKRQYIRAQMVREAKKGKAK